MMATVRHVTAWAGRTKYQADGFLLGEVYINSYACAKLHYDKQMNFNYVKLDVLKNLRTFSRVIILRITCSTW